MTSPVFHAAEDPFRDAAGRAFAGAAGSEVLASLGWPDILAALDEREARAAAVALFLAQGEALASSPALGGLVAQPYLELTGHEPGTLVATVPAAGRELLVGDPGSADLLVDGVLVPAGRARLRPFPAAGRLELYELYEVDAAAEGEPVGDAAARDRGHALGRLALAAELLGAAEGALALATGHARVREQFGRPIGAFQAVRHLLAWAATDSTGIAAVVANAVDLDRAAPPRYDLVVKAVAGRNARRVCERALQVLGAIGFTAEHGHHEFHQRVLALDVVLGSSAELTRELGEAVRGGLDPLSSPEELPRPA